MAATNRPANISKYKWAKDKDRIVQPLYDFLHGDTKNSFFNCGYKAKNSKVL